MKKSKEEMQLIKQSERAVGNTAASAIIELKKKFNKTYHWCSEWDYMVICDSDKEFDCCNCF